MKTVTAILLAAGLSNRFGTANKLLLEMAGEAMVRRTAGALCASRANRVVVVLGHQADDVAAALSGLPIETVFNPIYQNGLVSSVRAGLEALASDAAGVMMCLADQPLLTDADYDALIDAFVQQPDRIIVPFLSGKRGNPVVLPATLRDAILAEGVNYGCRDFIDNHPEQVYRLDVSNPAYRHDFDTPEALAGKIAGTRKRLN